MIGLIAAAVWSVAAWLDYVITSSHFKGTTANLVAYVVFAVITGLIIWWVVAACDLAQSYIEEHKGP